MDLFSQDTITAISTPAGEGGIGIIRISGKKAKTLTESIFINAHGSSIKLCHKKVHYGYIFNPDSGEKIDEVLVTFMKSPNSYTTEDVAEINCHGGLIVLKRVLNLIVAMGARIAEPGEFTRRAFLGGRIDLAQAEAVMDLIRAKTDEARKVAYSQLKGELSDYINRLREHLIDFLVQLEARIDFCEDDISPMDPHFKKTQVNLVLNDVEGILETFDQGRIYREGVKVCIAGPPNAGKSTLLNTLLKEERAIVTPIPGTTRDKIEETINLKGVPLILTDTAGLRESGDLVESLGIEITKEAVADADLVLFMLDASEKDDSIENEKRMADIFKDIPLQKTLLILNKIDLGVNIDMTNIKKYLPSERIIELSLLKKENLQKLEDSLLNMIFSGNSSSPAKIILSNARHENSLIKTALFLKKAKKSIDAGMPDDFITIDLKAALNALGEITGMVSAEDLLDRIFSQFCIGK